MSVSLHLRLPTHFVRSNITQSECTLTHKQTHSYVQYTPKTDKIKNVCTKRSQMRISHKSIPHVGEQMCAFCHIASMAVTPSCHHQGWDEPLSFLNRFTCHPVAHAHAQHTYTQRVHVIFESHGPAQCESGGNDTGRTIKLICRYYLSRYSMKIDINITSPLIGCMRAARTFRGTTVGSQPSKCREWWKSIWHVVFFFFCVISNRAVRIHLCRIYHSILVWSVHTFT